MSDAKTQPEIIRVTTRWLMLDQVKALAAEFGLEPFLEQMRPTWPTTTFYSAEKPEARHAAYFNAGARGYSVVSIDGAMTLTDSAAEYCGPPAACLKFNRQLHKRSAEAEESFRAKAAVQKKLCAAPPQGVRAQPPGFNMNNAVVLYPPVHDHWVQGVSHQCRVWAQCGTTITQHGAMLWGGP